MSYFYTYKITFVDGHYYYGSRKSKVNPTEDIYWGSPKTYRDKWKTTMYFKSILKIFENGKEMLEEESILIGNLYNEDPLCLNKHNSINFSNLGTTHTPETRKKMSEKLKGKPHSLEHRMKISGQNNPMFGKPRSNEVKKKISNSKKGSTPSIEHRTKLSYSKIGENNPAYDKIWITDGRTNLRISRQDPIPQGYWVGMCPRVLNKN